MMFVFSAMLILDLSPVAQLELRGDKMSVIIPGPFIVDYLKTSLPNVYAKFIKRLSSSCYKEVSATSVQLDGMLSKVIQCFIGCYITSESRITNSDGSVSFHFSDDDAATECGRYKDYSDGDRLDYRWRRARSCFMPEWLLRTSKGDNLSGEYSCYEVSPDFIQFSNAMHDFYFTNIVMYFLPLLLGRLRLRSREITKLTKLGMFNVLSPDTTVMAMLHQITTINKELSSNNKKAIITDNNIVPDHDFMSSPVIDVIAMFHEVEKPCRVTDKHEQAQLYNMLIYAMTNHLIQLLDTGISHPITLPQYFKTGWTGRLFGIGKTNLQTASKRIRHLALSNFTDIDIDSSAITVMTQLARQFHTGYKPLKTDYCDLYIKNKTTLRENLARDMYEVTTKNKFSSLITSEQDRLIDNVKQAFTAITFGCRLDHEQNTKLVQISDIEYDELMGEIIEPMFDRVITYPTFSKIFMLDENDTLGYNFAKYIATNDFFFNYVKELKKIRNLVYHHYHKQLTSSTFLALYPGCQVTDINIKRERLNAYIYQTTERKILDIMMSHIGDRLLIPVHDGCCVSGDITGDEMSNMIADIKHQIGLAITCSLDVYKQGHKVK